MTKLEGELTWKDLNIGAIVSEPGNASQYKTGDWKSERPIFNTARCIKCGICLLYTSPSPRDRTRSRMPSSA